MQAQKTATTEYTPPQRPPRLGWPGVIDFGLDTGSTRTPVTTGVGKDTTRRLGSPSELPQVRTFYPTVLPPGCYQTRHQLAMFDSDETTHPLLTLHEPAKLIITSIAIG